MGKKKKSKGGSFLMQGSILAAAGIHFVLQSAGCGIKAGVSQNGGRRAEKCIQGIEGITDHSYAIWCHDHGDRIFWSRGDRRISDGSQNELLFFEGACSRTSDLCDYGSFSWLFPGDGNDDPDCNFADH